MKAIVTGARGTVGRALMRILDEQGHQAQPWDRTRVPIGDYSAMSAFVDSVSPDVIFHLAVPSQPTGAENEHWLVNWLWPSELAWLCRERGAAFVFASTVMVYSDKAKGPFTPDTPPDTNEGYAGGKLAAEARVREQHPSGTRIARLGWQISTAPGANSMIEHFRRMRREKGAVCASRLFIPACSFVEDSALSLIRIAQLPPDTYLVDSNVDADPLDAIARALSKALDEPWNVQATEDFAQDQRMLDPRVGTPALRARLPWLGK
jgi:dTDP-4-dehydrorhamnose reductase